MKLWTLLLVFWIINPALLISQRSIDPPVFMGKGMHLKGVNGQVYDLDKLRQDKVLVVYILSPDCPLCQSYTLTMNSFNSKYQKSGVVSIGVFPGKLFSKEEIKQFEEKFNVNMLLLLDPDYLLTGNLKASVTPEVFLMNKEGRVMYSGRIDNWAYSLGKKRQKATEYNLRESIENVLSGKEIITKRTRAVGCIIE